MISAIEDVPVEAPTIVESGSTRLSGEEGQPTRQKTRGFIAILLLMIAVAGMAWFGGAMTSKSDPEADVAEGKTDADEKTSGESSGLRAMGENKTTQAPSAGNKQLLTEKKMFCHCDSSIFPFATGIHSLGPTRPALR